MGKQHYLQTACAFNICLKCKVVRDDEWQRQSCLLIMYGKKKKKTSISIKRVLLEKGWTQSVISLVMGVRVETKPLMSPRRENMRWSPSSCKCLWSIDFPIISGLFSSTKSFPSLSQLAFGPGNAVDRHLPICLSVASFHRSTAIGRGGG